MDTSAAAALCRGANGTRLKAGLRTAQLRVSLTKGGGFFSNVAGRVAYKERQKTGGVLDLYRFEARLEFNPFGIDNVTLDIEHADGRNFRARQHDDCWLASLGARF